jgi:hypothetical protein
LVAAFCLRLAAGLILMLPLLSPAQIPPRFYRVHFLTALGLLVLVGIFSVDMADAMLWVMLGLAGVGCLLGSIVWHLDEAPGGSVTIYLTPVALLASLVYSGMLQRGDADSYRRVGDDVLSALVLGSAMTAMLMGHSYLIAPAMTLAPLMRLLAAVGITVALRIGLACFGLREWAALHNLSTAGTDLLLWLPIRWLLGLVAPLVLAWMAWETARIRSTQSATGILYVVVIVCFLGELTSLLLVEKTGFVL